MPKESFLISMAKLITVVSLIVVIGLMGYFGTMHKINNLIKFPVSETPKTCEANSDCYVYSPCNMGSSCLNKTKYDKAMNGIINISCPAVEIYPWQIYRYDKEECSCLKGSCINVYSEEKYCKSIEESFKWCGNNKPFEYSYSPDEDECQKIKNLFDENCGVENDIKDETVDWQTYRNEEYGFELKYPENYSVETKEIPTSPIFKNTKIENLYETIFFDSEKSSSDMTITVYDNGNNYILEQWLKKYKETSPVEVGLSFGISPDKEKEITIDGVKGLKGDFGCCMTYRHSVFLKNENKIYQIAGGFLDFKTRLYPNEEIFNQILSTFKFIEN